MEVPAVLSWSLSLSPSGAGLQLGCDVVAASPAIASQTDTSWRRGLCAGMHNSHLTLLPLP